MSSKIILKDEDFIVGERVYIEVRLFDEIARTRAIGTAMTLVFVRPNATQISSAMAEDGAEPGFYRGSAVVDVAGEWTVEVRAGSPAESVFRHSRLYVSA